MATKLNAKLIDKLQAGSARLTVRDAEVAGLELRVSPSGKKIWSVRYRAPGGNQRRLKIGKWPTMDVTAARKAAKAELVKLDAPIPVDPQAERQNAKRAAAAAQRNTVEQLCTDYIERHAKPHKRTWRDDQSKINREILPHWKGRPVTSIMRRDCRELLQAVIDRGAPIYAGRIGALLSRLFRFAVENEIINVNPAAHLPKTPSPKRAEREVYTPDEIRSIWLAAKELEPAPRAIYRLGIILGQRPSEISDLAWDEIDGPWWNLPGRRTKNARDHRVFLPPLALEELEKVPHVDDEPLVFAGWRGKRQLAALNLKVFASVRPRKKPRHALRHTVATGIRRAGVSREHTAAVLNHSFGPAVTRVYDSYDNDLEKRRAMLQWERALKAILEGRDAVVVDIEEGRDLAR